MEATNIESRRVQLRMLTEGAEVWAPFGDHGWRAGTVIGLGKNRADRTVVHLSFETGGKGRRVAGELLWRNAELKGKDKPKAEAISAWAVAVMQCTPWGNDCYFKPADFLDLLELNQSGFNCCSRSGAVAATSPGTRST